VVPQVELLEFCNGVAQNHEKPLAISKAIKSINANYKDGENGFTEIKSFGKCFGTVDFKEGTAAF
jgi:enoyl-CoA hydratase